MESKFEKKFDYFDMAEAFTQGAITFAEAIKEGDRTGLPPLAADPDALRALFDSWLLAKSSK